MKKIYILMCLVCAWSCVNSMDEPCELPIAGNWAGIDEDGAVLNYIEFKTGKYYEYASESKHYYSEKKIWHAKQSDFALQAESWYSVSGGKITFCGRTENISYTDNVLKIGDISYCPVDALDPEYGFTLTHQIPIDEQGVVQCSVAAHEIVWDCRISGLPDSARPDVELSESWVRLVSASEGQLRLQLDENTTSSQRSASVKLSHPAIVPLEFTLTQMIYGLSLSSNKTTTNYAGGSYEFSYSIENSYPEITAIAHSNKSWVTDVAINDGKVSFKVQENNSGQARSATIAVSYGTIVQLHTVEQSYEAATLTINNFYRTCSHLACERSFTNTITNPRSSYRLIVSCDAVWITDIKNEGGKITYKVSEN